MKYKVLLVLAFSILLLPQIVFANEESKKDATNDGVITIESFDYLARAKSIMYVNTNNTISVKGETESYSSVDKISVSLYLEKYSSGKWNVVDSWYFYETNDSLVIGTATSGTLSSGTYRIRGYHRIDNNGSVETTTSYSSSQTI